MNTKMFVTYMIFLASAGAGAVLLGADADATKHAIAPGKFEPTWESLKQYECPEWFRDAKFGIWAHWGVQCVPEQGDWYAWHMYRPSGDPVFKYHLEHYGHPSEFGLRDLCNAWKAEKWDPENLVQLYKRAGATAKAGRHSRSHRPHGPRERQLGLHAHPGSAEEPRPRGRPNNRAPSHAGTWA